MANEGGDKRRHVLLIASAERIRLSIAAVWEPVIRDAVSAALSAAARELGSVTFDEIWKQGAGQSLGEAVTFALEGCLDSDAQGSV